MPRTSAPSPRRGFFLAALTALLWLALAVSGPARAAVSDWQIAEGASARLIAAVDATGDLEAVPMGLEVRLDPGWHTYWRSPGDAGLPPVLDASLSANLADLDLAYPAPRRATLLGIDTFGYADHVVFPLTAIPATPGAAMDLRLSVQLLVCAEICIPATYTLGLDLPAGPATPDADAANLIDRYAQAVPGDGRVAGLTVEAVAASGEVLTVAAVAREPFEAPDILVEGAPGDAFSAPDVSLSADGHSLAATLTRVQSAGAALEGAPVTLTLIDGDRAMEVTATAAAGTIPGIATGAGPGTGAAGSGLAVMIGAALLGGLILNLMPCVLPVLSLKLLGAIQAAGGGGTTGMRAVRAGFLASAAGILVSFLALAALAIGLAAAGRTVGWGIQFQEPLFLVAMVVVLTVFAANLLGLFEIALPWRLADAGGRASLAGPFWTGVFATLLATPCSAPFLGTAVGFALGHGPAETVAIFTALAVGFAAPYLLVAAFPGIARRLPRPGPWMRHLKLGLAAALLGTAVWLVAVLATQLGATIAAAIAALMAMLIALFWLRRRLPRALAASVMAGVAITVTAAFAAPLVADRPAPGAEGGVRSVAGWQGFDADAIADHVARGEVVFVDITAEWCLTCKVNEMLVLATPTIRTALEAPATVAMLGDWTRPDPAIAEWLAANGRYGIPFNAVYGPAAPEGIILPELLTEGAVLDALARARGTTS